MATKSPTKICSHCQRPLPATAEYFYRRTKNSEALMAECKKCIRERNTRFFHTHHDQWERRYQTNREQLVERSKVWARNNPEKVKQKSFQYYWENRDKILKYHRAYSKTHPEKFREYSRRWKQRNPDHLRMLKMAGTAVKRALRKGILKRPKICQRCHKKPVEHAHHYKGYAPEFRLTVQWLCINCHIKAHGGHF